ncbi:L-alanine-DL-glutamate epimerase-like enolase superfamily enzyme [Paenibacillus rhizosphaerae]|uniref:L-alanine-DL-glutamate epimerase-like enolase superfamily enzyme n=1 Tax=Paenibacillus rhizosphaerae TaxID=297318 RepID=A0A839U0M3_9BACL|nr:mandelate racemase/muconate lactonizing enzyme family protein [Paenibacillus rhizosphaerae]MBB3131310.1 L-alanine-DL-glutamate epimerase-like enolase superfamily enzyme [Paenibacillus rhizosphaerae]
MKIIKAESFILHVPITPPITDAINVATHWGVTGIRIYTDEGITGYGYTGTCAQGDEMIAATIDRYYAKKLIGKDPFMVKQIWDELRYGEMHWIGRAGVTHMALAAVDIALWDIMAKASNKPLWQLLGGHKSQKIKAYNTNGGWLNWSQDRLIADMTSILEEGFTAVKMKVGKPDPREDFTRVQAVRRAIGDQVGLMIDVNQQWNITTAMTWGKKLEQFDLLWLEEPLNPDDIMNHRKLADELNVPIALGEHVYSKYAFRDYIHQGAVEYVQADVTRVAGITEWLQIAGLAAAYDLPICPHVGDMGQIHQHLVASTPNAVLLEYIPWIRHIFEEPATVKDGFYVLPQMPGASTEIIPRYFDEYRVQ